MVPTPAPQRPIVVYGATGVTGELTVRTLIDRGLPVAIAGRDRSRLAALAATLSGPPVDLRVASLHDRRALVAALSGAEVVINCAGPFVKLGEPVVAAAIAAGAHYLDPANEQPFVRDIYERYESAARRAGVTVVSALGVEGALADWLAALVARRFDCERAEDLLVDDPGDPLDELWVGYAVSGWRGGRGAELALVDRIGAPGFLWRVDRWEELPPAAEPRQIAFPAPFGHRSTVSFPAAEVITVPRHVRARRVQGYLAVAAATPLSALATRMAALVAPALPALARSGLAAQAHARIPARLEPPTDEQRAAARFALVVGGERNFERHRITALGSDPHRVTAEILADAAARLRRQRAPRPGVLAPTQAFEPEAALAELTRVEIAGEPAPRTAGQPDSPTRRVRR